MKNKELLTIKEAAEVAEVSTDSIRRWADLGHIAYKRTKGNHRRIDLKSLKMYLKKTKRLNNASALIYARVPHKKQQKELKEQINRLENYCATKGLKYKVLYDISTATDFDRKNLKQLIKLITNQQISQLILNYGDSLLLVGNEIIFELCKINKVEVIILSEDTYLMTEKDITEEFEKLKKQCIPKTYTLDD